MFAVTLTSRSHIAAQEPGPVQRSRSRFNIRFAIRRGGVKSMLLAALVGCGVLVGGGLYFSGEKPNTENFNWLAEKTAQFTSKDATPPAAAPLPAAAGKQGDAVALNQAPVKKSAPATTATGPAEKAPAAKTPAAEKKGAPDAKAKGGELSSEQKKALTEIRKAMSERQLAEIKTKLADAAKLEMTEPFKTDYERLKTLEDYLVQFWQAVNLGGQKVQGLDELIIGSKRVSVVEYVNETLVIRVEGENRRYHLSAMPMKVALTLASHYLKVNEPVNKVIVGAFLAMDYKGDREQAKTYWDEAKKAGLDVASLLPELGIIGPAQLNVPERLTPAMKSQLMLPTWLARREKNSKWTKGPLGPVGKNSPQGWLSLILDGTVTDNVQIVKNRRLNGDFTCRMILDDIQENQVCGLFAADDKDASWHVPLPAGVVHIEFSRKDDKFTCNINGAEVPVESTEKSPADMPGMIGISLPPKSNCVIAYFEFINTR